MTKSYPSQKNQSQEIKNHLMSVFSGQYTFQRNIDVPSLIMRGIADFNQESDNLITYNENGFYLLENKRHVFYQKRYFYFNGLYLDILTVDKKILHRIALLDLNAPYYSFRHTHECNKDKYFFHFYIEQAKIVMKYKVCGPSKNYNIETLFKRKNF